MAEDSGNSKQEIFVTITCFVGYITVHILITKWRNHTEEHGHML